MIDVEAIDAEAIDTVDPWGGCFNDHHRGD